jgi:DNA-binding response OmpR family regulator
MKKILLVEPAQDMGKLIRDYLADKGYGVAWAKTAQKAVHLADESTPDAVILELIMPGHNGVEFIHELKSYTEWMEIPIILYTHLEPDRSLAGRRAMSSLGISEHLYKPTTTLEGLLRKTRESLV